MKNEMRPEVSTYGSSLGRFTYAAVAMTMFAAPASADVRGLLSISPNGARIAAGVDVGKHKGVVHLYAASTLSYLRSFPAPYAKQLQLSSDGKVLAFRGHLEIVFVDTDTGAILNRHKSNYRITFSEDGRWCMAQVNSPRRNYCLISMTTGEIEYAVELPKGVVDVEGYGFSGDREHFVLLGESYIKPGSKEQRVELLRYSIADGNLVARVGTTSNGPKNNGGGFLTLHDGYMIESGKGTLLLRDDGSVRNLGRSEIIGKSNAFGGTVILGRPRSVDNKPGVQFSVASTVDALGEAISWSRPIFAEVPYNRLKPEQSLERIYGMARRGKDVYLTNGYGTLFLVTLDGRLREMVLPPTSLKLVAPPAEAKVEPKRPSIPAAETKAAADGLAEIVVEANKSVSVAKLKVGAARLSGGYKPKVESVADELDGASFIVVPWKSRRTYEVTVTRAGYLYAMKAPDDVRKKTELTWEARPGAINSPWIKNVHRAKVSHGQRISISSYELSLIAKRIELK